MRVMDSSTKIEYWIAPENLQEEKIPEPNYKKPTKINNEYIGVNAELRKNQKRNCWKLFLVS